MEKAGICQKCGKIANRTCRVCGATVCHDCIEEYGCKICKIKKKIR